MNRPAAMMTRDSRHRGYAGDTPFLLRFIDIKTCFFSRLLLVRRSDLGWTLHPTIRVPARPGPEAAKGP